jgi:hypothetical protein
MMKKMLVLLMVLAVAVFANAQLVETVILDQLEGPPPGDYQGIPSYEPSTWLLIGLVPHNYGGPDPITGIARMKLDLIAGDGHAANPQKHAAFDSSIENPPVVVNGGGVLIAGKGGDPIDLQQELTTQTIPDGEPMILFEYHVPDLPWSTIILIDPIGLQLFDKFNAPLPSDVIPLEIHVSPEPMTVALLGLGGLFLRRRK